MDSMGEAVYKEKPVDFKEEDFKIKISKRCVAGSLSTFIHPELEIKLFYEEGVGLMIGEDHIVTRKGDIVVANPYEIHSTLYSGSEQTGYCIFLIGLDFFGETKTSEFDLRYMLFNKQMRFQHLIRGDERLQKILCDIIQENDEKKEYYKAVIKGKLYEFFSLLIREYRDEKSERHIELHAMKYYPIIEPALFEIRKHYAKPLTILELADLCSVSKFHFCRIFKKVTNTTIMEYINGYRFKMANVLLERTDLTIAEICAECGFGEQGYFCRCYKKKYGVPPSKSKERQSGVRMMKRSEEK